jgi:hypothetical protein
VRVSSAYHGRARGVVKERVEDPRPDTETVENGVRKTRAQERPQRDRRCRRYVRSDRLDHRTRRRGDVYGQPPAIERCEKTPEAAHRAVSDRQ